MCSYDEVLRFKTSVAKFIGQQEITFRGLNLNGGTVMAWMDNYDLNVFTPNGMRETHAMAIEFTQHPGNTVEEADSGDSTNLIPQLSKKDIKESKVGELAPIPYVHYTGPKKPSPPNVTKHEGKSFIFISEQVKSIEEGIQDDLNWLSGITKADEQGKITCEWSGHMLRQSHETGKKQPATKYIFGPLIFGPHHDLCPTSTPRHCSYSTECHSRLYPKTWTEICLCGS